MTKLQYQSLSAISLLLCALLLGQFVLTRSNSAKANRLSRESAIIAGARQIEPVVDRLVRRIAKGSETDPQLKQLLARHGLKMESSKKSQP